MEDEEPLEAWAERRNAVKHWHAYAWTGNERPDEKLRVDPSQPHPPLEIAHWLRKPRRMISATFDEPDAAVDWLKQQLTEYPPLDVESLPVESRIEYARETLGQTVGADVVYGYYSGSRYVSRALITCPRRKLTPLGEEPPRCPEGR